MKCKMSVLEAFVMEVEVENWLPAYFPSCELSLGETSLSITLNLF